MKNKDHIRWVLRDKTQITHQHVDDLFSQLDLALYDDYRRFVQSNKAAFDLLERHQLPAEIKDFIGYNRAALKQDAMVLGIKDPIFKDEALSQPRPLHPIGVHYVLAGASFGKKILKDRWAASSDARLKHAGHYLSEAHGGEFWQRFLALSPVTSADEAINIIESADAVFNMFAQSYHHTAPNF